MKNNYKEIFKNSLNDFIENHLDAGYDREDYTLLEWKYAWLCDDAFGVSTYDTNLSVKWGKLIFDVMTAIRNHTTFDYIKDDANYEKYIAVCNLFNIHLLIDWGSSIRGAWFSFNKDNRDFCLVECHEILKHVEGEWVPVHEEGHVNWSEEAVNYLIDVFFKEEEKGE